MIKEMLDVEHHKEAYPLISGIVLLLTSLFFFTYRFQILNLNIVISDNTFLWIFACMAVVSAIIHLISVIDF